MARRRLIRSGVVDLLGIHTAADDPLALIPWTHAWYTLGDRSRALNYQADAAVTTWPDEIGSADMTRNAAGPIWKAAVTAFGGRPAVATDGLTVLRTGAGAISVSLPYSVFSWVCTPTPGTGAQIGGQTNAAAMWFPISFIGSDLVAAGSNLNVSHASDALANRFTTIVKSGDDTAYVNAGVAVVGTAGDTLLSRVAVGGAADVATMIATQCVFLGIYQGDIATHHNFPRLRTITTV
jgi:hypothetical protein